MLRYVASPRFFNDATFIYVIRRVHLLCTCCPYIVYRSTTIYIGSCLSVYTCTSISIHLFIYLEPFSHNTPTTTRPPPTAEETYTVRIFHPRHPPQQLANCLLALAKSTIYL
jgi:hypothetical protein